LVLNEYENITIYDAPAKVTIDGVDIDIVPWICADNEVQIAEFMKNSTSEICFGHFEIAGFEMDRGNVCESGIDKQSLSKYDVVLTGHFHHKSTDGNITYVGTPYEMTWADWNDPKGFHIFDTNTRDMEFIQNPFAMFHKVSYDDGTSTFEDWKKYDFDKLKEFLSSNSEFTDKLKTILHTDSLESTEQSLLTANKTNLMKGMTDAKLAKDMDLYKFLDVFLKNGKNIS
jgi:hypothetical protein